MNVTDFRSNPILVAALKELLVSNGDGNPSVLARAIVAVQNERPSPRVDESSPEIVSVRRSSKIEGFDESLELLLSCAEPMPEPPQDEEATFGIEK